MFVATIYHGGNKCELIRGGSGIKFVRPNNNGG